MSCARIFVSELHSLEWVAIFLARVAVGLVFFLSGRAKLFVPERRKEMRQTLIKAHVVFPEFNAVFVSTVEFVCGLLLVLGLLTPLATALLAGVMIVAIATTAIRTIKATSPAEWLAGFLYLPEVLYLVILFWLFLSGPGWLSVDHLFLSRTSLELCDAMNRCAVIRQALPLVAARALESRHSVTATRAAVETATQKVSPR